MPKRASKRPPALRYGAYSSKPVLPGEDRVAFEKLHTDLITEHSPVGALECDIVADLARHIWRKNNLSTLRIAKTAAAHRPDVWIELVDPPNPESNDKRLEIDRVADAQLSSRYGTSISELLEAGEAATFEGVMQELAVEERLTSLIGKCLRHLLFVRGLKSISATPVTARPLQIASRAANVA
jgi:hypothetical protein